MTCTLRISSQNVLHVYDSIRRPRTQQVWEGSRRAGDIYELVESGDDVDIEELRNQLHGIADFVWHHKMEDDVVAACEQLKTIGAFV